MRAILLLSGGLDSTVLAYHLAAEGKQLHCLSYRYGQRASDLEIGSARRTARKIHGSLTAATFSTNALGGSSLTDHAADLPESPTTDVAATQPVVVPARNLLLIASAVSIAVATRVPHVYVGFTQSDEAAFPDCSSRFLQSVGSPLSIVAPGVSIIAPFSLWSKAEVVARGAELGVPWVDCYSCYAGKTIQCGRCGACLDRASAFSAAGATDVDHAYRFPAFVTLQR